MALILSHLAGLRVGEIAGLILRDIFEVNGDVREQLRIRAGIAKGGHERVVFMSERLRKEIERYRDAMPDIALREPNAPFLMTQKRTPFSSNTLCQLMAQLYRAAGFDGATSHSCRRWFITRLAHSGVSANRKFSREEIVNQERAIAHEEQTPEADQRVAGALRDYAEIVRQCDGLAAARSVREEVVALSRSRASSERDHGSLGVLADDIAALACLIEQIEGVASAVSLMDEEVDIRRKITLRAPFADSAQLALSLSRLGQSVRQLRGRAPARPYYEEQVSILRERVRHYNSASCKSSLAYGLLDLAELLDMLEGPAAADGLRREVATLHSAIQVENEELDEWNQVDLDVLTDRLASTGQLSLDGDPIM